MLCRQRGHANDQDHPRMKPKTITTMDAASCEPYAIETTKLKNNAKIANWTRMAFLPTGMRRFVTTIRYWSQRFLLAGALRDAGLGVAFWNVPSDFLVRNDPLVDRMFLPPLARRRVPFVIASPRNHGCYD